MRRSGRAPPGARGGRRLLVGPGLIRTLGISDPWEDKVLELGRTVLEARRTALVAARDERRPDDEVVRGIMEEIDLQQAVPANWEPGRFSG